MMHKLIVILVGCLGAAALIVPLFASAFAITPNSFGGKVGFSEYCTSYLGPSWWVQEIPASPLIPPFEFIWTLATPINIVPVSVVSIPPTIIGTQFLGRFDIPYFCCPPPSLPTLPGHCVIPSDPPVAVPPLIGMREENQQTSLVPLPSI